MNAVEIAGDGNRPGVRPGEVWQLKVQPPERYAGWAGARAVVQEASATSVYVVFESGLREVFPPGRFASLFTLASD